MYNTAFKEQFLSAINNIQQFKTFHAVFNTFEIYENQLGKDLYEFSDHEVLSCINALKIVSSITANKTILAIKKYQDLCHENGLRNCPGTKLTKYDVDFVSAIKETFFSSVNDFLNELKYAAPAEDGYFGIPALCLAWVGLDKKMTLNLLKSNIDLRLGTINDNDNHIVYEIQDEEVLRILRIYQNISVAYRTQNRTFEVYPMKSPYFIRKMATKNSGKTLKPITPASLSNEVSTLKLKASHNLGYESRLEYLNVYKSGQFQRLFKLEKDGLDVDDFHNNKIIYSVFSNKGDLYDCIFIYHKYKEAFGLS